MGSGCISQLSFLGVTLSRTLKGRLQHPKKDEHPVFQVTSERRKMQDRPMLWEVRFSCGRRGSAFPPYPAVPSWLPQGDFLPHCLGLLSGGVRFEQGWGDLRGRGRLVSSARGGSAASEEYPSAIDSPLSGSRNMYGLRS